MAIATPNTQDQKAVAGQVPQHDLRSLLRLARDDTFFHLNVHQIGRIEKFYPADQTADVSMPIQRFLEGRAVDLPVLVKCPVFFLTGGSTGNITMPIKAGDTCMVLFNDRDMDSWWTTGSSGVPLSRRAHDMSDAVAIVGFRHKGNAKSEYSDTNIEINNLGSKIAVGTEIKASASGGAKIDLADKAKIYNGATDLRTVLNALIDAIKAQVDTRGDSLNGGTIAALDAVKSQLASLLQ